MEKIVEVEVVKEIIKEVERVVYKDSPSSDCMSQDRFISIWNKLFQVNGHGSSQCITEEAFVDLISQSVRSNANDMTQNIIHKEA